MSARMMTHWALMAAAFSATAALAAAAPAEKTAQAPGLVAKIKVLPDKAPDCSSLKSIVESITRECKTNDEKAIAIYNFMQLTHYHFAYPGEPGGFPSSRKSTATAGASAAACTPRSRPCGGSSAGAGGSSAGTGTPRSRPTTTASGTTSTSS